MKKTGHKVGQVVLGLGSRSICSGGVWSDMIEAYCLCL